jgi:uncharacterized protein (DUF1684 family)
MDTLKWKENMQQERIQKDIFLLNHYNSPLSIEDRHHFKGLDYYPPDPAFYFELELHEHEEKKVLKIEDTKGNERDFLRWGKFRFKIDDKEYTLQVYKSNPQEENLFVPFRDKTSGRETYGAGRYLDLDIERHYTPEEKWILDFNNSYNPWCAYSEFYACPYVDPENWLDVEIKAGEKNYALKKGV